MAAEAVVSSVIERLSDLLVNEARSLYGVRDEVEAAEAELQSIRVFLEDADARARQGDEMLRRHVARIREAASDLEDVVTTYAMKVASRSDRGRIYILLRFPCIWTGLRKFRSEVEEICAKIAMLRSSFLAYGLILSREGKGASSSKDRQRIVLNRTFSHVIDSDFVGLKEDIEILVSHLTREGSPHKVVSICGMGGLGKTTLARLIYHHSGIRHHFDGFAWASVSQNYQVRDVLEGILINLVSSTSEQRKKIKEMESDEICKELYIILEEKKCLVVLDDIWNNAIWDHLKFAFPDSESKVLFTTRMRDLAFRADQHSILYELRCLSEIESWELFVKRTYFGRNSTDLEYDQRKQKLARQMLYYCGGLPLAITALSGLLTNKEAIAEWETLHKNIKMVLRKGKVDEEEDFNLGVSWVLGLSYDDLPYQLKPCLLHLAYFPEDFEIRAKELCRLWMAEGFVADEDVAYECLIELVQRCIVHVAEWGSTGRIKTCRIHDLMRDLCLSKAQEENFLQAVDLSSRSSSFGMSTDLLPTEKVRRLAIYLDNNTSADDLLSLIRIKDACLRSLVLFNPQSSQSDYDQIMKTLLRRFRLLRVLKFEKLKIGELPKEIGDLVHLRLFSLRDSYVGYLSPSIGNLRCLQTLDLRLRQSFLSGSKKQIEMPSSISKLEQMRHLYLPGFWSKTLSLDTLVNLQTLVNAFANDHCLDRLAELASLTKLKINLALDFKGTGISFNNLQSLAISYLQDGDVRNDFTENVISVVLSCPQICKLHLAVRLVKLPEDKEFSPNLTKLTLVETWLEDDPMATLEKLPSLRILLLGNRSFMGSEMVCTTEGFPKLESLSIHNLEHLREWRVEEGALPSLSRLHIEYCSELRVIPDGLSYLITLKEIVIQDMPKSFKHRIEHGGEDFYKVQHVPSLVFMNTLEF